MSEIEKKNEIDNAENEPESRISKQNKHKHNSKRRCKKNQPANVLEGDSSNSEVEVSKLISSALTNIESQIPVKINPTINKMEKESQATLKICTVDNQKKSDSIDCSSYSTSALSNLFKNLQMESSSDIKEILSVHLLRENNGGPSFVKNLKKHKHDDSKKETNKVSKEKNNEQNNSKKYFNLNADQNLLKNLKEIDLHLLPEVHNSVSSDLLDDEGISKKQNYQKGHSIVDGSKGSDNNKMAKSTKNDNKVKTMSEKKPVKVEISEKNKKSKKKKERKENMNESNENKEQFDGSQEVFLNLMNQQSQDGKNSTDCTSNLGQNKKLQHSSKSSGSTAKVDTKFPKYLPPNVLKSLSNFGVLMSGLVKINKKNNKEAYITPPDKGMDILIDGLRDRNRALEGDEVFILLKQKKLQRSNGGGEIHRTGVVVGLKTLNHSRGAIGTLNPITNKNISFAWFSPRDMRLPKIRIKKSNIPKEFFENSESFKNKLYFAKITCWDDVRFAEGELIEEVGQVGNIEAETNALLLQYDLEVTPYSRSLKQYIPSRVDELLISELQNRHDLRQDCIFTIDPETATDLDDALSCKELPNGNYQIGVHISDVSFFLKEGTPLDSVISERATTIYLVQRVYHMLPPKLCKLCSLSPGEDKLAFSVLWEVTPDFRIVKHKFAKTVINSCAQFSYKQVQSILKGSPWNETECPKLHGEHKIEDIKDKILFLHKMAVKLRTERFKNGALTLNQRKIEFFLDENNLPVDFTIEEHEESHQLIEEFMLLANITVAELLSRKYPDIALLRSHAQPVFHVLRKLQNNLKKFDISLDISKAGSIHESLMKYTGNDIECMSKIMVLYNLIAKPMARASYFCSGMYPNKSDRHHYALNVPLYTHFTSPIRRYADIMVHRLLTAWVLKSGTPKWTANHVQSIANICNKQKYAAKVVNEMSIEVHFSAYIGQKGLVVYDGVVCDVKDKSFECILFSTGMHQKVYLEQINAELTTVKKDGIFQLIIKWPAADDFDQRETIQIIQLFSIVKVELRRSSSSKIESTLLRCR